MTTSSPPKQAPVPPASTSRPVTPVTSANPTTKDHTVSSFRHRLSQREYPPDCPPLSVRWFYAVDVPKKKPYETGQKPPPKPPSKYVPFAPEDSKALETTYQKLSEEEDEAEKSAYRRHVEREAVKAGEEGDIGIVGRGDSPVDDIQEHVKEKRKVTVPVNEDYLFDVDIRERELAPTYWLGPVYDVRRGTWFYQEGNTLRPCDENLATQLEEGYLQVKPFRNAQRPKTPSSAPGSRSDSPARISTASGAPQAPQQQQTWRLYGSYINSFVVFADSTTAWLLTDDFYGKLSATVWQRVTAGSNMGGIKIVRGYTEPAKTGEKKDKDGQSTTAVLDKSAPDAKKPGPSSSAANETTAEGRTSRDIGRIALERKLSTYAGETEKLLEDEMKEDYRANEDREDPARDIEHLILVTHGIGQKLGMRLESVNFVHDVNVLRKSLKSIYGTSPELQLLNNEGSDLKRKNSRIQVLPVCWRHLLDFPKQSLRENRGEQDLATASSYEDAYPSLEDITVEGVPSVRNLVSDLALDILLYQSTTYREHIVSTVLQECNRIYALFRSRNPTFKGKVSFIGHSLGSAIMFDILCRQPEPISSPTSTSEITSAPVKLDFDVEHFFALGSPIGLFQMLQGSTITARPLTAAVKDSPYPVAAPACKQIFNIFHPSDPIAYRLEPLVSKAMAQLKPQPLPYTKRGLFSSNGPVTNLSQTVSRSVGNFWNSLSTGIASSLINRSLGIDGSSNTQQQPQQQQQQQPQPPPFDPNTQSASPLSPGSAPLPTPSTELETLFSGFQNRGGEASSSEGIQMKKEDEKVRRLNRHGRVDWAIQEGVFDISLIASIASHLAYWGDEDVGHFVVRETLLGEGGRRRKRKGEGR
ncbi:DDHD-domain-containing protein [Ascodesmis nigricans]|uniref:DDHD-domain-containing protein n=1 Tax=Ascodesmis nigricans TaxID=341454 RepID=A0A4S2N6X2_9PEZI|nr:DDHD-domain-containing protein [Ascodesmis nigricans]